MFILILTHLAPVTFLYVIRNHDVPLVTLGNVIEVHETYMPGGATRFLPGPAETHVTCHGTQCVKKIVGNSAQVTQQRWLSDADFFILNFRK